MKRYKQLTIPLYAFIILSLAIFSAVFGLSVKNRDDAESKWKVQALASQEAERIKNIFDDALTYVRGAACQFGDFTDDLHSEKAMLRLKEIKEESNLSRMCLTTPDGHAMFTGGYSTELNMREYVKQAMNGESGISSMITSVVSKKKCFVIFAPIYHERKIIGMIHGTVEVDNIFNTKENEINKNMNVYMYSEYGRFLFSTPLIERGEVEQSLYNSLASRVGETESCEVNNEKYVAAYHSVGMEKWNLLLVMPYDSLACDGAYIGRATSLLSLMFLIVFIVVVGLKIAQDISIRTNLSQNASFMDLLDKTIHGGIVKCKPDDGYKIVYMSKAVTELFGYSLKEIKDKFENLYGQMIYMDDRQMVKQYTNQKDNEQSGVLHYRVVNKAGQIVWLEDKYQMIKEKGNNYLYCLLVDNTDKVNREQEIKVQDEVADILFKKQQKQLFEFDYLQNKIVFSDRETHVNIPASLIEDKVVHPDDKEVLYNLYDEVIQGERYACAELRVIDDSGKYIWNRVTVANLRHGHELVRTVGIMEDITEQKIKDDGWEEKSKELFGEIYQLDFTNHVAFHAFSRDDDLSNKDNNLPLEDCLDYWSRMLMIGNEAGSIGELVNEQSLNQLFASNKDSLTFICQRKMSPEKYLGYFVWVKKVVWNDNSHVATMYSKLIDVIKD